MYLNLACNKLEELTSVAEQLEKDGIDIQSMNNMIKINTIKHHIVINTQTPNRQLWYSSTISGPQRFNYIKGLWQNGQGKQIQQIMTHDIHQIINQL